MTEAEIRARVVEEARSWVGTPYHNMADLKGVGVDCGMLLVRVFVDLALVEPFDPRPYTHDWMLHRSEEVFMASLLARAVMVEEPAEGDVILFKFGRCYSHGAIVSHANPLTVVHAALGYKRVVEEVVATNPDLVDRMKTALIASIVWKSS